ncbi:hypothetical protein IGB42_04010 [Andreprevotia sp. IGB-42]|nr:hypothetical protein IGB42_04010 [Andreprevotia sp. IGB-42]
MRCEHIKLLSTKWTQRANEVQFQLIATVWAQRIVRLVWNQGLCPIGIVRKPVAEATQLVLYFFDALLALYKSLVLNALSALAKAGILGAIREKPGEFFVAQLFFCCSLSARRFAKDSCTLCSSRIRIAFSRCRCRRSLPVSTSETVPVEFPVLDEVIASTCFIFNPQLAPELPRLRDHIDNLNRIRLVRNYGFNNPSTNAGRSRVFAHSISCIAEIGPNGSTCAVRKAIRLPSVLKTEKS